MDRHLTPADATTATLPDQSEKNAPHGRPTAYRADIDGIRAIAVLGVVLFHAQVPFLVGGFSGVDIFFVISGYLIGGHIFAELQLRRFSFLNFYRNRAKRILPALYVVLTAVFVAGVALLSPTELRDLASSLFSTTASASNLWFWKTLGYFAPAAELNPLLMTWSLGVEEQFYFVIPVLLVVMFRIGRRSILPVLLLLTTISFALACYQLTHNPISAFYLPTGRAWELCAGVILAILQAQRPELWRKSSGAASNLTGFFGLLFVCVPLFVLKSSTPFPGLAAVPSVFGTIALLASGESFVSRRILSQRTLGFIGKVSYSFYLIHWPLLAFLRVLQGDKLPVSTGLAAVAIAFLLAIASYFLVETPFRASKRKPGPLLVRYAVLSLLILLVSAGVYKLGGLRSRFPAAASLDARATTSLKDPCIISDGQDRPNLAPICTAANQPGPHIALWGDSHAAAVASSLKELAATSGYQLEEFAKPVCPPLLGVGRYYREKPLRVAECVRFNQTVMDRLLARAQIKVVVLYAYWDAAFNPLFDTGKLAINKSEIALTQEHGEILFQQGLHSTLDALTAAGKRVVILGDTPSFDLDPIWRMRTSAIPLRLKLAEILNRNARPIDTGSDVPNDESKEQRAEGQLLKAVALTYPAVTYWDMRDRLCSSTNECRYRDNALPLFYDTNHLSSYGGRVALEGLTLAHP